MSLRRVQTCDQCGKERDLGKNDSPQMSGWRDLSHGLVEATFCNVCVTAVVDRALAARADRLAATPEDGPQ